MARRALAPLLLALGGLSFGCNVLLDIEDPKHRPVLTCGDGKLQAGEACDDGNTAAGDGCDASCKVETGYACSGTPSACQRCGDGKVAADEGCDDGNTEDGDGCKATCQVESGYQCTGQPSACTAICGDGFVSPSEPCDDHNTAAGDGCDGACKVEPGYTCKGEPSACAPTCGDGKILGGEACDDGNAADGDGCSHDCKLEHGFTCSGEPTVCTAKCGDGVVASVEQCDDGNNTSDDGCAADCKVEHGYSCAGEPSLCGTHCGDGELGPTEQCDDGNNLPNDGCSPMCTLEVGFTCSSGEPTKCTPVCGDGLVRGGEQCDDGNVKAGDGCDVTCHDESGFTCNGEPSSCAPVCGDGLKLAGEACDDGNLVSGDCCSSTCQIEAGCEIEPNNSPAQADTQATGVPPIHFTGNGKIRGSIGSVGDADYYVLDLAPANAVVRIETFDGAGIDCLGGVDTKLTLLNGLGVPIYIDKDSGISACSALEVSLQGGSYYVKVEQEQNNSTISLYTLEVDVQSQLGGEVEPNDATVNATPFNGQDGYIFGSHLNALDVDYFKITLTAGGGKSVRAETVEGSSAKTCESNLMSPEISLYSAGAVMLADDSAGSGRGLCALLDGTGTGAMHPGAHGLAAGSYYLRVKAAPNASMALSQFDYKLAVTIR